MHNEKYDYGLSAFDIRGWFLKTAANS
jgi:hypothetical protein